MGFTDEVEIALDEVVAAMPGGGEARSGQRAMARAVAETIAQGGHLVVQAGTGTGKTLAYLLAAAMSGRKTVVATYTKALQDQMGRSGPADGWTAHPIQYRQGLLVRCGEGLEQLPVS